MQKINSFPKGEDFAFRVVSLMQEELDEDLQKLQFEDGERYRKRCKDWPEYKRSRICPKCPKVVEMLRQFTPTAPYGGALEYTCKVCKYCERLA